jgi:hypothetical protein
MGEEDRHRNNVRERQGKKHWAVKPPGRRNQLEAVPRKMSGRKSWAAGLGRSVRYRGSHVSR